MDSLIRWEEEKNFETSCSPYAPVSWELCGRISSVVFENFLCEFRTHACNTGEDCNAFFVISQVVSAFIPAMIRASSTKAKMRLSYILHVGLEDVKTRRIVCRYFLRIFISSLVVCKSKSLQSIILASMESDCKATTYSLLHEISHYGGLGTLGFQNNVIVLRQLWSIRHNFELWVLSTYEVRRDLLKAYERVRSRSCCGVHTVDGLVSGYPHKKTPQTVCTECC